MNKYIIILLYVMLLTSCDKENNQEIIDYGYDDIEYAISRFEAEFGITVTANIRFSTETYNGTVARCYQLGKTVELVLQVWKTLQPIVREALIYHELGHCELGINEHTPPNTIHIMSDFLGFAAQAYRDFYEAEVALMKSQRRD